jgi:hypothetical protein
MTAPTDWVELTASCGRCGHQDSVSVPQAKYTEWKAGANIAWVFKNLSAQQREILIGSDTSRPFPYYLCAPCWDHTFKEDE